MLFSRPIRFGSRILKAVAAVLFVSCAPAVSGFGQEPPIVTASWIAGGANVWSNPVRWTTNPCYPHNLCSGDDYKVVINAAGTVFLNVNATVNAVKVGPVVGALTTVGAHTLTVSAGNFTNNGAGIVHVAVGGTIVVLNNSYIQMTGAGPTTVDGVLKTTGAGSAQVVTGGSMFGLGTIDGTFLLNGTLTPGDSAPSPGTLTFSGLYTQSATGALDINLASSVQYGVVMVSGTASLAGTLNITLQNGFVPVIGQTFVIVNAASVAGAFATVNGTAINASEHFVVSYTATSVVLTVVT
jgi:hypothetical protein